MSYFPPPMPGLLPEPVTLLPPRLKTWLSTYRIMYGVLLGPLIFIGLGFHYCVGLNWVQLASAMAAVLILLLNVYFYVLRKRKEDHGVSIWIDLDEIQLLKKNIILYKDSLKDIRVIQLGQPTKSKKAPTTLLIEGKHFPRIFIYSAQSVKIWRGIGKVDFCVASEKEWIHLLQVLAACEMTI